MKNQPISYTDLFSDKAYAKFRPSYGQEVISKIVNSCTEVSQPLAVDVGAGTGIASRLLADHGLEVICIEPNRNMISAAKPHCRIKFKQATAVNTTLTSNSADLVTCFQAFHWFNFKKSLAEFNRILKKSGRLALVWNYWNEEDEFTLQYSQLIKNFADKNPNPVSPYSNDFYGYYKKWRIRFLWKFKTLPYFTNIRRYTFEYYEPMCSETLIGCAKAQSYILHDGPEWDRLCSEIKDLCADYNRPRLTYNINLFIGEPKK